MEPTSAAPNGVAPPTSNDDSPVSEIDEAPPSGARPVGNWTSDDEPSPESMSHKELFFANWHPTVVFCGVFWSFGMCVAFLGPTLLDLGCQTSSDIKRISWVFFAQLCCTLIGSLMAGYLASRSQANFVILVATALIPVCMFVIPFCEVLPALAVVLAVMGINMGIIDCLANLQMIKLYGENVAPFLQAMHFCYGLGAFVSPMIAEPFLLNEDCSIFVDNGSTPIPGSIQPVIIINETSLPAKTLLEAQEKTRVRFAFWIMCILQIPIPLLVASLLYREKLLGWKPGLSKYIGNVAEVKVIKDVNKNGEYGSIKKEKDLGPFWQQEQYTHYYRLHCCASSLVQVMGITICAGILMFIFDGLQSEYGGYIYSYAEKSIVDLNKTEGAYLNALFWGMFALGRLLAIPLATVLTAVAMMGCNITGCVFAMALMLGLRHDHRALYVGTAIFGLFLSSGTPTTLAMAEGYIDISPSVTSFVVVAAALGDMLSPVIVGHLFVDVGPVTFLEYGLAFSILAAFFFIFMIVNGSQTPKHKCVTTANSSSYIFCRMCCLRRPVASKISKDEIRHVKFYTRMSESDSNYEMGNIK